MTANGIDYGYEVIVPLKHFAKKIGFFIILDQKDVIGNNHYWQRIRYFLDVTIISVCVRSLIDEKMENLMCIKVQVSGINTEGSQLTKLEVQSRVN